MVRKLLNDLGYHGIEDAIEFLMCGLATLPGLLMLNEFMLAGAASLTVLLVLLAAVGMHAPPPEAPSEKNLKKTTEKTND